MDYYPEGIANNMKRLLNKIRRAGGGSEYDSLIRKAMQYPRHTKHSFAFKDLKLVVSDFISVAWQLKEIFEEESMKFTSQKKDPVIVDCGSNVGLSVIYFKKLFPLSKVIAFEPDPVLIDCLKENLKKNNISGVELIEKAVWINDAGVSFGSDGADGGSVFLDKNKIAVPSVRLNQILEKENDVDFLKMDIEGAEIEVFLDCEKTIAKVKNIFVEYHSWINQPQRLDQLLHLFASNGFRYYITSIGREINPFINKLSENSMDIQLNIRAIKI